MFDQIREPKQRVQVNRTALLTATAVVVAVFIGVIFTSLWLLDALGLSIGPDPLGPVEVWYDPYEDGTEPP